MILINILNLKVSYKRSKGCYITTHLKSVDVIIFNEQPKISLYQEKTDDDG